MLDRVAVHQTRLRTPGLGLDGKGVALGTKGLVLLPSIDRLVALLSVYTRDHSLEDLMPSLAINLVRSKLGTREITLEFAAESTDAALAIYHDKFTQVYDLDRPVDLKALLLRLMPHVDPATYEDGGIRFIV